MEELDILINKYNDIKDTHPQLHTFWTNYLQIKKKRFRELLDSGDNILNIIKEQEQDISLQNISLIYITSNILYKNNEI
tara:strand:+ start:68 stop:304 length:237 start_codon:yes stop_codon:yes gene_type:complete